MFVYPLDRCLSQLWMVFWLSFGCAALVVGANLALRAFRAKGRCRALASDGITGKALADARRSIRPNAIGGAVALGLGIVVFAGYIAHYSRYPC